MKVFTVLVVIIHLVVVYSETAEEMSPNGIVDLWNKCKSEVELETLVGNTGEPMKPLLYNKHIHVCQDRVKNNIFLHIGKGSVKDFSNVENESFIYIHNPSNAMLNPKRNEVISYDTSKKGEFLVVELVPEHLKNISEILELKAIFEPVLNGITNHGFIRADSSGQLKIQYKGITYIDFGAYTLYQILGLRSVDDVRKSQYYPTMEQVILPTKYNPGETYKISWKTEMTTYAAKIRLTLQTYYIGRTTAIVSAIVIEEKIAKDTIKIGKININTTTTTTTEATEIEGPTGATVPLPTMTGASGHITISLFLALIWCILCLLSYPFEH